MKILIPILIFLLAFPILANATSCNEPGYKKCWWDSYCLDADTCALAQFMANDDYDLGKVFGCTGNPMNACYIKDYGITYKCNGDRLTYVIGGTGWEDCDENGCPGTSGSLSGRIVLASVPADSISSVYFYCWDKKTTPDGGWAWTMSGWQWNEYPAWVVNCANDYNCPADKNYCDNTGSYDAWNCRARTCIPGEIRCNGNDVEKCNSLGTVWETKETCQYGCSNKACVIKDTTCEDQGLYTDKQADMDCVSKSVGKSTCWDCTEIVDGGGNGEKTVRPDLIDFIILIITFIVLAILWVV